MCVKQAESRVYTHGLPTAETGECPAVVGNCRFPAQTAATAYTACPQILLVCAQHKRNVSAIMQ
jgi:hypothetical protein